MTIPNIVDSLKRLSEESEKLVFNESLSCEDYRDTFLKIKNRFVMLSDKIREKKLSCSIIRKMHQEGRVFSNPWKTSVNVKINSIIKLEERLDGLIEECELVLSRRILDSFIACGQVDRALALCGEILSSAPWDDYTHRVLSEMGCGPYPDVILKKIMYCQNTFHLRYLKTVGQGILTEPQSINISADDKILFVSDQAQNVIHRFTMDGDHLGICEHTFTKPHGMCNDDGNRIWACDYLGQHLVLMDRYGQCEKVINMKEVVGGGFRTSYPYSLCIHHRVMYILASDVQGREYSLVKFPLDNLNDMSCRSTEELGTPYGLWCSNGTIYVGSLARGRVYIFDPCSSSFQALEHELDVSELKSFVVLGDSIYYSSAHSIAKSSKAGGKFFSSHLDRMIGRDVCLTFGLAVTQSHESTWLALPDGLNQCVHVFSV